MSVEGPGAKDMITTGLDSQQSFLPCPVHLGEAMLLFDKCISHSVVSDSLRPYGLYPTRLLCPQNFPGKSTGVGCHYLLRGIFPNQGSNPAYI